MTDLDIATAPDDGTRVLVFVPKAAASDDPATDQWAKNLTGWFTAWFESGHWHTGLRDCSDSSAVLDPGPTRWMPCPPDPEAPAAAKAVWDKLRTSPGTQAGIFETTWEELLALVAENPNGRLAQVYRIVLQEAANEKGRRHPEG